MISLIGPKSMFILLCLLFFTCVINAQQLAFPTAEGYGKYTKGGRGGKVYEVTTLNGSGAGSLGEAIAASGARTVVFRVSGTIESNYVISNGNLTIAGQTAPGDGICIKGNVTISANDIIIRYIRVRPNAIGDALGGTNIENIILDHLSCSWSNDEVLSIYLAKNLTIQYCLISEACPRGGGHRFGGIWGAQNGTYHHNCFAHNSSRTPRWAGKKNETNDFRNNVIYNWGYGGCYGALGGDKINMIANYYKPGPASENRSKIASPNGGDWHVSGNVVVGSNNVTQDNWKGLNSSSYKKMDEPWPAMPIKQESAEEAYKAFLKHGGCSFPNRDALDKRIIEEINTGTAKYGNKGLIGKPSDVGGWPELSSASAPSDKDHDGIPDAWESKNGLNPNDASDGSKTGKNGYTNLENYINGLVDNDAVFVNTRNSYNKKSLTTHNLQFFPSLMILHFSLYSKSKVTLEIFDSMGHSKAVLVNTYMEAGIHRITLNNLNLPPGSYIYRFITPNVSQSKSIILIKH
jgi:pectate lyase